MKFNQIKTQTGVLLFSMLFSISLLLGSCIIVEPVPVRRPVVIKVEEHHNHKHGHKHGHEKHEKYEKKKEHKEEEEEDDSIRLN